MKVRLYIYLILGILFMFLQLSALLTWIVPNQHRSTQISISDQYDVGYRIGQLIGTFIWGAIGITLLVAASRIKKKIKLTKQVDNFLK
ncbi:MAG: hypothetical protein JNK79_00245 [Chitinophagaceae bacterium]|nr:hypothetical protein [Chitinophagaceae bacterium]